MVGKPSRRSVLKSIGASGIVSTGSIAAGSQGNGNAIGNGNKYDDLEIVDYEVKSKSEAKRDLAAVTDADEFGRLAATIEDDSSLAVNFEPESYPAIELVTNSKKVNKRRPAIVHVPIEPVDGHIDPNNGGVLLGMTAERGNERLPLRALGITREPQDRVSRTAQLSTQSSSESITVTAYGETNEGVGKVDSAGDTPITTGDSNGGISTQSFHGDISCFGCTSTVGIACAGAATLSISSCASAAISAGVFSPWAGGAAAAFCTYIVANAGTLSCAAGTTAICAGGGFCSLTE